MGLLEPPVTAAEKALHATIAYYRQADGFVASTHELLAWYTTLPPQEKHDVRLLGPYQWAALPAFKRYVLERRGYSLAAYLALHLTAQEFAHWEASAGAGSQVG